MFRPPMCGLFLTCTEGIFSFHTGYVTYHNIMCNIIDYLSRKPFTWNEGSLYVVAQSQLSYFKNLPLNTRPHYPSSCQYSNTICTDNINMPKSSSVRHKIGCSV
jgi:hypothetical protein